MTRPSPPAVITAPNPSACNWKRHSPPRETFSECRKNLFALAENVTYGVYSAYVLIAAHDLRHPWQVESALRT